jgi:hypothetical protein
MLAIVAVVELLLAARGPTNLVADTWADAYARVRSARVRESSVLCLGDSQIKLGVDAAELGRLLGEPAYNLAVHAGQSAAAYNLLRRALDSGARPRAIVVGFYPGVLLDTAGMHARLWSELLGWRACLDLAIQARDARFPEAALPGIVLASCRARLDIRRNIAAALDGKVPGDVPDIERGRIERREHRGSAPAASRPEFRDDREPPVDPIFADRVWKPTREGSVYLHRLLALARERGIAVYWITPPLSPAQRERLERSGLIATYEWYLRRLQAEYPGIVVLDSSKLGLDRSSFIDIIHLDTRGSLELTAAVARAIRGGGSRWVALNRDREGTAIARGADAGRGVAR